MKKLRFSHIVVNGCSFTYCQGIEKPYINGWPALLGKQFDVPVINLAIGGSGNDAILRRTYEYFYKNKNYYNKPLYIIALSSALRREEFFKSYKGKQLNDFHGLDLGQSAMDLVYTLNVSNQMSWISKKKTDLPYEDFEFAYISNLSFEACERKKFIIWNALINLFKANKVPYLIGDYMPTVDENVKNYMTDNFKELYFDVLNDENYIGEIPKHVKHLPKLPCGHDDIEAQQIVFDLFYKKIVNTYDNVLVDRSDKNQFLKLKDFYPNNLKRMLTYHEWLNFT